MRSTFGTCPIVSFIQIYFYTLFGVSRFHINYGEMGKWFFYFVHCRKDSSLAFMWFFFVMLFQVLSFVINGIGIPNMGAW